MDLKTSEPADIAPRSGVCGVCGMQFAKYSCPRCNLRYCGTACYRSDQHATCSEAFYKNEFMAELNSKHATPEQRRQMLDILKRAHEEEQDADDDVLDGIDDGRFDDVLEHATDDDDDDDRLEELWSRLSLQEQKEFTTMVQRGALTSDLRPWQPWWEPSASTPSAKKSKLVTELVLDPGHAETTYHTDNVPVTKESDVPPLSSLLGSRAPARELLFNSVNVLCAYAFALRLHNGDTSRPLQPLIFSAALDVSSALRGKAAHSDAAVASQSVLQCVQANKALSDSWPLALQAVLDASIIIDDWDSVARAFNDMHMFSIAAVAAADKHSKSQHKAVERKLLFFRSWWAWFRTQAESHDVIDVTVHILKGEHARLAAESREVEASKSGVEDMRKRNRKQRRPLIQEL